VEPVVHPPLDAAGGSGAAAVRALAALPTGAARALLVDLLRRADAVTAAAREVNGLDQS